jgi:uncharacterized protein (DUF2126 family)/transglutaminase-like putative cysteine protease
VRILLQHLSRYRYPEPASLGPHLIRLRPAAHARARIESYGLRVTAPGEIRWQQDPSGNFIGRATWSEGLVQELEVAVELAADIRPVNPFDFTLDASADQVPFDYGALAGELRPCLDLSDPAFQCGALAKGFLEALPPGGPTVAWVSQVNSLVQQRVRYVVREEAGIWTPEETLAQGRGSCRDSAVLLVAAFRSRGLAARFVSGYLIQLADDGMLPDMPKGVLRDVADLHAWAEVFLPGAGWIGLDATSGLFCGEGHIPLAATAIPALAAPIEGTSDVRAEDVSFEMRISRLGHEVSPTAPFTDSDWNQLVASGLRTDALLKEAGLKLTTGGEPTFISRLHGELPEWNGAALGESKWMQGLQLAKELLARLLPGGVLLLKQGKTYPGESLPRWTLELIGRRDGKALWTDRGAGGGGGGGKADLLEQARRLTQAIASALNVEKNVMEAFEDPWRAFQDEGSLPIDVDPLKAKLGAAEERVRLARILDRGLNLPAGFVLPLAHRDGRFVSETWTFRRGHLFLLLGDSSIGLRLPLNSLAGISPPVLPDEAEVKPKDPRSPETTEEREARIAREKAREILRAKNLGYAIPSLAPDPIPPAKDALFQEPPPPLPAVHTALTVQPRDGALQVFLPPLANAAEFIALIGAIDAARASVSTEVRLEGYGPASSPALMKFSLAPDPGVLEVNLPPTDSFASHAALVEQVFDAALHSGLHAEKHLLDGRQAGSGGGNHLTLGGPTPLESPFVKDPRLLASLITFAQHHPSLSYLFSGLFVGPTSQAPRIDEARHDSLYEMELALDRAFKSDPSKPEPPWLADQLFRHLLVDVSGNGHRAEICIDKLFDWRTPHGRQGLIELRAFEMPPHPRMVAAQAQLIRALIAAFAKEPYQAPLVRWGPELHDRFLLPTWIWNDLEDVLAYLKMHGQTLPAEVYRAFLELRCPVAGRLEAGGVVLELRNALEPWPVLGEEPSGGGTSRYVDSSLERVEIKAEGLIPGRHAVLVNGHSLPLRPTGRASEGAAGVRFRAWAPAHSLHAHLGIHHPLRFDLVDLWTHRSLAACAYHVWHPEGRGFLSAPLTRFEAAARRAQRFTLEAPLPAPVSPQPAQMHPDTPWTLDLRRLPIDRRPPTEAGDSLQ